MLVAENAVYLLIPEASNNRMLHTGKVLVAAPQNFEAEFEESVSPAVGADVNVYAEIHGKFFQQGAKVQEIRPGAHRPIFVFERIGEPVSAEQRQAYRVSAVTTGIVVRVGKEERCPVVDISPEGLGVIVRQAYQIGSSIDVLFRYWSEEISAKMRVQTVQGRPDRKFRIGFLSPEKHGPAGKALQKLSASIQRTHLGRLSGAA